MQSRQLSFLSFIISLGATRAFIFTEDKSESVTLMNHEYDDKCVRNETVASKVNELKTKYQSIKRLSRREIEIARFHGIAVVCEAKRDTARSVTDWIQPIGDYCVQDEKKRKKFVLNTLLLLETILDYFCEMKLSHVDNSLEHCFASSAQLLMNCVSKSYNLYFWESVPDQPPTLVQLLNASVCNFDFDKMLSCSSEIAAGSKVRSCSSGAAIDHLAYQFEVIKRHSLCFNIKDVSEVIDNSSEDTSNIVSSSQ